MLELQAVLKQTSNWNFHCNMVICNPFSRHNNIFRAIVNRLMLEDIFINFVLQYASDENALIQKLKFKMAKNYLVRIKCYSKDGNPF